MSNLLIFIYVSRFFHYVQFSLKGHGHKPELNSLLQVVQNHLLITSHCNKNSIQATYITQDLSIYNLQFKNFKTKVDFHLIHCIKRGRLHNYVNGYHSSRKNYKIPRDKISHHDTGSLNYEIMDIFLLPFNLIKRLTETVL